jgi:hypothetical protein
MGMLELCLRLQHAFQARASSQTDHLLGLDAETTRNYKDTHTLASSPRPSLPGLPSFGTTLASQRHQPIVPVQNGRKYETRIFLASRFTPRCLAYLARTKTRI